MSRYPGAARNPAAWYTIVGVAADVQNSGLTDHNDPEYYLARRRGSTEYQDIPMASAIVLRGGRGSAAMLRAEIAALDPALPVVVRSFGEHVGHLAARPRFQAWLLLLFAGIGMLRAAFGWYGLLSFLVAQREREFGVRLALGAMPADILKQVLGDALRWTLGGLVCGLAGARAAAQALRGMLFHVSPADPSVYVIAAGMLTFVAIAAACRPAMRAARVDPATALRHN